MADSEDEELRQPAEEHQMQRGPDEMEGVTAMLPKLKFLESCYQDTDVAKEVALMAGFKLAVGPRVAFEFYNTIETRDLDEMVSKSADSAALMSTFQKNSSHKCKELVLVVKGPGNVITVPDILNGSKIPLRMPTRSQGVTAGTFTSGGIIEVGKSFCVPSIPSGSVFKYFAAKLTTMIIRCRYPLAQSQNGEYKTFSKSSLSVIHVGATGSGMTVLHNYGDCPSGESSPGWTVSHPIPQPVIMGDHLVKWREMLKEHDDSFSTAVYLGKAAEKEILPFFDRKFTFEGDPLQQSSEPNDISYDLTQSFFDYTNDNEFWKQEEKIPFLLQSDFDGMCAKMVLAGDVDSLDIMKDTTLIKEHFLNKAQSWCGYMALVVDQYVLTMDVPDLKGSKGAGNESTTRHPPWSDTWLETCSNKSLGLALQKIIATFKHIENGVASRQEDWKKFLLVAGPKSTLEWSSKTAKEGWLGDNEVQRVQHGLGVGYGTAKKFVAEAMVLLASEDNGKEFPAVYSQPELRKRWEEMHGDLKVLEDVWLLVDPTYKRTQAPKPQGETSRKRKEPGSQVKTPVSETAPPASSFPLVESAFIAPPDDVMTDIVSYIDGLGGVQPSDAATAIAKHLTEEADSDPEEIAKFLQAYADLMVRKSAQTSSAGAMPPIALSGRADLIEDTLVATLRKIKGTLSIDKKEDIELFQFLAGMLTSRGNSAALSKDEWKELKERLTQTAFF